MLKQTAHSKRVSCPEAAASRLLSHLVQGQMCRFAFLYLITSWYDIIVHQQWSMKLHQLSVAHYTKQVFFFFKLNGYVKKYHSSVLHWVFDWHWWQALQLKSQDDSKALLQVRATHLRTVGKPRIKTKKQKPFMWTNSNFIKNDNTVMWDVAR